MKTVGIIGAGIGGVAVAAALHRFGISATVYERAEELQEVGAGIMLWPNATRVLKSLGLLDEIARRGGASTHFLLRASCGSILMNIALGEFNVPALCTRRSDLLTALIGAVPRESIRLGRAFTRFEQSAKGVRLHFADGSIAEHGALITADGIRSAVRTQLFGISNPVYRGYTVWRGIAACASLAMRSGYNSETWGQGSRFGILDLGHGWFTWYATANADAGSPSINGRSALAERFAHWHDPIPALIGAAESIVETGAYDLRPLRRWTVGRVTLLGDAAHPCTPNLGQGGGMALEDALVLAKCIAGELRIETALRRYEALRLPRTRHVQQRSLVMGHIGQWQNRAAVAGRRAVARMLPAALFEHNLRRVYSYET